MTQRGGWQGQGQQGSGSSSSGSSGGRTRFSPYGCYHCGQMDHLKRDCLFRRQRSPFVPGGSSSSQSGKYLFRALVDRPNLASPISHLHRRISSHSSSTLLSFSTSIAPRYLGSKGMCSHIRDHCQGVRVPVIIKLQVREPILVVQSG